MVYQFLGADHGTQPCYPAQGMAVEPEAISDYVVTPHASHEIACYALGGRCYSLGWSTRRAGRSFGQSGHGVPDKQGCEVLEAPIVKVSYDEDKPGVILDYDDRGNLVAVEILDASKRITDARRVDFQMTE